MAPICKAHMHAIALIGVVAEASASALGAIRESFTTNAICAKNNCVNPIFPAMEDLHLMQKTKFICSSLQKISPSLSFCKNAVGYEPAIPAPSGDKTSIRALVELQDNAASTAFYYHITGLGMDAWEFQKPEFSDNDCIKSIWRMVCFTYFPRAKIGCQDGEFTDYIRPCKSSCMNYVRSCAVECCDESVECVFSHTKRVSATKLVKTSGYLPHDGPSSLCTGAARHSATPLGAAFLALAFALKAIFSLDGDSIAAGVRPIVGGWRRLLWVGVISAMALSLHGCDYDVPVHEVGNWRAQPDYLMQQAFVPPGASPKSATLNSCSIMHLSQSLQCNGRGVCKNWNPTSSHNMLAFCECDRDFADAECNTRRQSQVVAYMLSIFGGLFGADQFYLGFPVRGFGKLFTLGGLGVWWLIDIVRIGSAPVYASNYLVAADLPHFAYVLTVTMLAMTLGFYLVYKVVITARLRKRRGSMLMQLDEEARQKDAIAPFADSYGSCGGFQPMLNGAGGPMNDVDGWNRKAREYQENKWA